MPDTSDRIFGISSKQTVSSKAVTSLPTVSNEQYILDLLSRIEFNTRKIAASQKHRTNYHVHYYIDTSSTTRRKIDLIQDMGTYASELIILDNGGGFTLSVNDEGYNITSALNFQIVDESITKIYVTGSGSSGTGRIRMGAFK